MTTNLYSYNSDDYRDRYTRDTKWVKLLFNHGRPLQSAELIEIQSILQDFLKQGLDTLFANGTTLYGLKFSILSVSTDQTEFSMSSGKLYVDGIILDIESQTISVPNTGDFNLGLYINPSIITEDDDPNLRDPIKGGALYGLAGAARLVWQTSLVLNNPSAFTLARVVNGGLIQKDNNIYSKIDESLANYTYARTGNFCLPGGLELSLIETRERAITDINKYRAIQESTNTLVNQTQEVYSQLLNANNLVSNLNSQVQEANSTYNRTPTNTNLIVLQDLQSRLTDATNTYNELSRLYVSKKIISDKAEQSLVSAQALLTDKVYVSVSPGVAYVEGYRKEIVSPVILEIPKTLEVSTVKGALFTYSGSEASTLRTFTLQTNSLWADVVNQNTLLTLSFSKLLYNQQFVDISITLNLVNNNFNSLDSFLEFLVAELNRPIAQSLVAIQVSSTLINATTETLRTIIRNNLSIEKIANALQITSTTINEDANQIEVSILIKERDANGVIIGDSDVLIIDVPNANLAGAGSFNSYQLGFRPVADILTLVSEVAENNKPIVRGVIPGTTDKLGDDSIFKITKVYQGNIVYQEGVDYNLVNQSEIDWSLSTIESKEPASGTTYYVSFLYTQPFAKDIDYKLNQATDSIEFIERTPAPNQKFYVDYTYYQSQSGVITLDKQGNFNYTLSPVGLDDIPNVPINLLTLGSFKISANNTQLTQSDCKVITFAELQTLVNQVKRNTIELEKQRLDISSQLEASTNQLNPLGYYNSTIQDLEKLDIDNTLTSAAISPSIQSITGGFTHKDVSLRYAGGGLVNLNEFGDTYFITLPYTDSLLLSQERLTNTKSVNVPISISKRANVIVYPELSFSNKPYSKITSCDPLTRVTTLLSRLSSNKSVILNNISTVNQTLFRNFADRLYKSFIEGIPIGNIIQDTSSFLGYISNLVKANNTTIKVRVEGLPPNSDGYRIYLSGNEIKNYTLFNNTSLSAQYPGSIRAKSDGTISFTFNIPNSITAGSHALEVIYIGDNELNGYAKTQIGIYNNLFTQSILAALQNWDISFIKPIATTFLPKLKSNYFNNQTLQFNSSIINPGSIPSITSTLLTKEQEYPILFDSLYQSFKVYDYCYLTKVNIKLKSISLNSDLVLNLGEIDLLARLPNRTYYCSAYTDIYTPNTSGNNWTTFTFTYPILISPSTTYCISLVSKDSGYEVFTAEVAGRDLLTGNFVGDQLYLDGDLFYSNDGKGINKLDREDLTYQLNKANFNTTEQIVDLGNYGNVDNVIFVTQFCLNNRDIVPPDSFIQYQYKPVNDTEWINFEANQLVCLDSPIINFSIRAKLSSLRSNVSPSLMLQGATVSLYTGLTNSIMVSKKTTFSKQYKDVYITLDYLKPAGTTIAVYYSPTDGLLTQGQEWFELTKDESTEKYIDQGLQVLQATWKLSNSTYYISNGEARTKFRFRIDFSTTNIAIQPNVLNIKSYVV